MILNKRPHAVHFLAIKSEESICIKASISWKNIKNDQERIQTPIQAAYRLLNSSRFRMKIIGLNDEKKEVFKKSYDSDSLGNFYLKIPRKRSNRAYWKDTSKAVDEGSFIYPMAVFRAGDSSEILVIQAYETSVIEGVDLLLGTYYPLDVSHHPKNPELKEKKIVICDFDKTLVDTRYSTTSEIYESLTRPLSYFPTVDSSVTLLKKFIDEGLHPFILSASPHFYENAMRDWLYQNQIYTAGIFLKDYRRIFSFIEGDLKPKDLRIQGLYKMIHLFNILLMTGIPKKLVLMGDNFESDPSIYVLLSMLLNKEKDPWQLWQMIKTDKIFLPSRRQNSQFLNLAYQLGNLVTRSSHAPEIEIFIRRKKDEHGPGLTSQLSRYKDRVTMYDALAPA